MRKCICIIMITLLLSGCTHSDTQMDVYHSMSTAYNSGYTERITVCLNDEYKDVSQHDYIDIAEDIIQRYVNNECQSTLFSFDEQGYHYELDVSVKRNKEDDNHIFSFSYHIRDTEKDDITCDIVHDKEKYIIEITD